MNTIRFHTLLVGMALASLPLAAQTHGFVSNYSGQVSAIMPTGSIRPGVPAHLARMPEASIGQPSAPRPVCTFREGFHVPAQLRNEQEPPSWTTLRTGTPVRIQFKETVSSKRVAVGDPVALKVLDPIQVDGLPVIFKGARSEEHTSE